MNNIRNKTLFILCTIGLVPVILSFIWFYTNFSAALKARTTEQLITVREIKKKQIEGYFEQLRTEVNFFAQTKLVTEAVKDFSMAFNTLSNSHTGNLIDEKLIQYYQSKINHKPYGYQKVSAEDLLPLASVSKYLQHQYTLKNSIYSHTDAYQVVHKQYHTLFSNFMKSNGYYDLFLVDDKTGYIVYSVAKEADFATNLLTDAYKNTHFAALFAKLRYSNIKNKTIVSDFDYYLPSDNSPHAFIGSPIFDGDTKIGTLIFQIPIQKIDAIATSDKEWKEEGLGESGECYILGVDGKMRTNSRFLLESPEVFIQQIAKVINPPEEIDKVKNYGTTILLNFSKHDALKQAGAKRKGELVLWDYRGLQVLSAFAKLDIPDVDWVLMAEIDKNEAFASFYQLSWWLFGAVSALSILIIIVAVYYSKAITYPIANLIKNIHKIEKDQFDLEQLTPTNDEMGALQTAFYRMAKELQERNRKITLQNEELAAQRDSILEQSKEILQKNILLEEQKQQLVALNMQLSELNLDLENKVIERTSELQTQARRVQEYAFMNAHLLRGPLTTLMSLLELLKISDNEQEVKTCLTYLDETLQKLDRAIRDMQQKLSTPID